MASPATPDPGFVLDIDALLDGVLNPPPAPWPPARSAGVGSGALAPRGAEKRAHERRVLRVPAQLVAPGRGKVSVRSLDVSVSGMGLIGDVNLPLRSACTVFSALPDAPGGALAAFVAKATVAYCGLSGRDGGFRIGLEFTDISGDVLGRIGEFVRSGPRLG